MYNLFLKDFYLIKKHLWFAMLYAFMVFFIFNHQGTEVVQGMSYFIGVTMIGYTMMISITAYEDKNNSEIILNSLPISRSKIVISRYLSILVLAITGILSMTVARIVLRSLKLINSGNSTLGFNYVIAPVAGLCVILFIYLPIYFKYGYMKAKMFNLVLFAVGFGGPMLIRTIFKELEKPLWIDQFASYLTSQSELTMGLFFIITIMILGLVSLMYSIVSYGKREF